MRRDFSGEPDLRAMQDLASRLWTPTSRFHPGQLAWNRYSRPVQPGEPQPGEAISLWQQGGDTVALAWAEAPDWLEVQVHPEHPQVAHEVLDWYQSWSDATDSSDVIGRTDTSDLADRSVLAMAGDVLEPALAAAGFAPEQDGMFLEHHMLDLDRLPQAPPAGTAQGGYTFSPLSPADIAERARCHDLAWADFGPSGVTERSYARLAQAWPYRMDLDWVARAPDGTMAASVIVWLDPSTGVGLVEPVGTVPGHRGHGLAGALTLAALHHLRELGGRFAQVTPRGDDGYPGPRRLYRSLGFVPTARTVTWSREP